MLEDSGKMRLRIFTTLFRAAREEREASILVYLLMLKNPAFAMAGRKLYVVEAKTSVTRPNCGFYR